MIYGKEPFDLRLTMLCMCRRVPLIAAVVLLGTGLFGGGYYVKNVLLHKERPYAVTSIYQVAYAAEEKDVGAVYINETSWNTYLQSQMFLDAVRSHLEESAEGGNGPVPENEELAGMLKAFLASDLRVPSTVVTTESPEKSLWIARGVEAAMTEEFAREIREIASIMVIDPGKTAKEVIPDVRVGRAFALSAVLSFFFAIVAVLLHITGEDGIRLPDLLWKRYGVKSLGTIESNELSENLRYFFSTEGSVEGGNCNREDALMKKVAVCAVQEEVDAEEVLKALKLKCAQAAITSGDESEAQNPGWFAVSSPMAHPENCRRLREAEGILLAVRAGAHGGRQFAHVLEVLRQQDCNVTAAILWQADEKLIRWYYGFSLKRFGRK